MQNDEIRDAVRAVIGSVAPGADLGRCAPFGRYAGGST